MNSVSNWAEYIRENENAAIKQIYDEHRGEFLGWVQRKSNCSPDEAVDIFQVSVVILYENVMSRKVDNLENVRSYLFTIGKNKLLEFYRKAKKTQHESIDDKVLLQLSYSDEVDDGETNHRLQLMINSLNDLGDPCKTLLENYYFKKLSMDEISETMNYKNADTVKTKKFKCIQRLRKIFKNS